MEIENEINSTKQEKNTLPSKANSSINSDPLPEMDIKKLLDELVEEQSNPMTSNAQLKRLLNTNFISPYEVLMISIESTEEEIKKQYRQLSLLVHPDKCSDSRAADAFHILETAYKTLQDSEKKKFFQRVIREAKERLQIETNKENKLRAKKGLPPLSEQSTEMNLKTTIKKIIDEIEERKTHTEKMDSANRKREREEEEDRKMKEEFEKNVNKEWESYRDKRVKNWNKFQNKILSGKRRGKYETRPPKYRMEERTDNDKVDIFRPNTII